MRHFALVVLVVCITFNFALCKKEEVDEKINIDQYLKSGYVVSIVPSDRLEPFWIDEKAKHVYVKVENAAAQKKPVDDHYYQFIPVFEATLFPSADPMTFNTSCFSNYSAQMTQFTETGAQITISAHGKSSLLCMDSIMVASRESIHFFEFLFDGTTDAKFEWTETLEWIDIKENGFQVLYLPNGYLGSMLDIWATYRLFAGKKSFQDGIQFMVDHMNVTFVDRTTPNFVPDPSEIMDGDYLAIFGPSTNQTESIGVASLISMGTGGRTSHVAICLHIDGELYVVESCGRGIVRTPYIQWMKVLGPEYMVSILRLREDLQEIFNASAAAEFFKSVEGLPYGNENFIYGWIDTMNGNYPPPLNAEEIPAVLVLGNALFPTFVNLGVGEGLNQRLNTFNLTIPQILNYCDEMNVSVVELITLPEQDSFVYPNPPGPRMVCDVFGLQLYRAAGIFGNLTFETTELTPKDSYQLQIFSTTWQRPQGCANDATPGVCQISGMYWLEMPGFNTIVPYTHMNEKCAAVPTEYIRTPANC